MANMHEIRPIREDVDATSANVPEALPLAIAVPRAAPATEGSLPATVAGGQVMSRGMAAEKLIAAATMSIPRGGSRRTDESRGFESLPRRRLDERGVVTGAVVFAGRPVVRATLPAAQAHVVGRLAGLRDGDAVPRLLQTG